MKPVFRFLLPVFITGIGLSVEAAPITFNTALPVAKDGFINREQYVHRTFKRDRSTANRDLEVNGLVSVLGYGVSSKLAVFAALPVLKKTLSLDVNGERHRRAIKGLGDVKLFGRYTMYQQDAKTRTFRVAVFGGTSIPTAEHNDTDRLGRLPATLQTGTGAWNAFGGLVSTYQNSGFQIDAQLSATRSSTAHGFASGKQLQADVSLQYRLLPHMLTADTQSFFYGVLEISVLNQKKNKLRGISNPNSGGTSLYLTPGIQYVNRKFILEAALKLPLHQSLHGTTLRTQRVFTTGFRINF